MVITALEIVKAMSSKWYMSTCFNTGLQASRVANDAIISMSITAASIELKETLAFADRYRRERWIRAVELIDELVSRINKPQMQKMQVWTTADSTTSLVYILVAKSAGDVKNLKAKLETSRAELLKAIEGVPDFSQTTFGVLKMIEDAAQEVVEENNSSLIEAE